MSTCRNPISRRIRHRVIRTVHRHRMLNPGDRVLCGVSGGSDSVALVHMLHRLASHFSIHLAIAHLNHQVRGVNAEGDARFVADLAQALDIPCHSAAENIKAYRRSHRLSFEEAARRVRYEFFDRIQREHGYQKIALGHHAEDNAEQVLMNLLRGSGKTGLSGIAPIREDRYVRPLIGLTRSEILNYLDAEGLAYRTDETNTDIRFLRNRIRHELIPRLKGNYNPDISSNLNRLAKLFREEEAWIEGIIAPLYARCFIRKEKGEIHLSAPTLRTLPAAPRRRVIRMGIEQVKGDLRGIALGHIEGACQILDLRSQGRRLDLPDGIRLYMADDTLRISRETEPSNSSSQKGQKGKDFEFNRNIPGVGMFHLPIYGLRLRLSLMSDNMHPNFENAGQFTAFFDMDRVEFPLHVRNIRSGDRFTPLGMTGTQKVKKWFIDHKVPAGERARFPLLLCGEKILWIMGHCTDDFAKVAADTQRVLKAELFLA